MKFINLNKWGEHFELAFQSADGRRCYFYDAKIDQRDCHIHERVKFEAESYSLMGRDESNILVALERNWELGWDRETIMDTMRMLLFDNFCIRSIGEILKTTI